MADVMQIKIITPEKVFFEGEADFMEFNTADGEVGIYPMHVPMTVILDPGVLRIYNGDEKKEAALHSGFAEILPDKITILAEAVEWPWEIDKNRAAKEKIRAERVMSADGDVDGKAELSLKSAILRIRMADKK